MNEVKISVIVPCYNSEKTIERCLDSLTVDLADINYEIIVIDDGSTDNTEYKIKKYSDKNIIFIKSKNYGVSHARNLGLEKARGSYIAFCDSDDYLAENYYSVAVRVLEKSDYDLVVLGFTKSNHKIRKCKRDKIFNNLTLINQIDYLKKNVLFNYPFNKVYRKQFIKSYFDESLSLGEDVIFNLNYFEMINKVYYLSNVNYIYTVNNDTSLSGKLRNDRLNNIIFLYNQTREFFYKKFNEGCKKSFYESAIKEALQYLLRTVFYAENYSEWKKYIEVNSIQEEIKKILKLDKFISKYKIFLYCFVCVNKLFFLQGKMFRRFI